MNQSKPAEMMSGRLPGVQSAPGPKLPDGAYAAYSMAWSPAHAGRVVRGCIHITTQEPQGRQIIDYVEHNAVGRFAFTGEVLPGPRMLNALVRQSDGDTFLFFAFAAPAQPAPALVGLMTGQALFAGSARPVSSRFLMVATRDGGRDAEARNGYLEAEPESIAEDLAAIGYGATDGGGVSRGILDYLTAPASWLLEASHQTVESIVLQLALAGQPHPKA